MDKSYMGLDQNYKHLYFQRTEVSQREGYAFLVSHFYKEFGCGKYRKVARTDKQLYSELEKKYLENET